MTSLPTTLWVPYLGDLSSNRDTIAAIFQTDPSDPRGTSAISSVDTEEVPSGYRIWRPTEYTMRDKQPDAGDKFTYVTTNLDYQGNPLRYTTAWELSGVEVFSDFHKAIQKYLVCLDPSHPVILIRW